MIAPLLLAAALLTGGPGGPGPQTPPPASSPQDPGATDLGEVVVDAQRTREAVETFVRTVAAPVEGRKVAVWHDPVCVGAGGLPREASQFLIDRISDWADSLGLRIGTPGCRPNIFVVATDDGDATARELVASRPREFITGVSDADRGRAALEAFQTSGRPVRWWQVSMPVDSDTGQAIRRLPGQGPFTAPRILTSPVDFGPFGMISLPSLIADETRDDLQQVIVVVDMDALDVASFAQVTDYVAMIALAQIGPDATPANPSILGLFTPGEAQEDTLTRWDRAYLHALYEAVQGRASPSANLSAIAAAMGRELERDAGAAAP